MDFIDVLCIVVSVQLINYCFKYDDAQKEIKKLQAQCEVKK